MNKKRIVSLSILATLLLAQLAACGDTPSNSDDTTDPQGTDSTEPIVESEYVKPDVNYNNETFTIASFNFDMSYALAKYTMINHDEEVGETLNDSIVKMTRQVEEDLNIKLELFEMTTSERSDTSRLTQSIYSGDDEIQAAFPMSGGLPSILGEPTLLTDLNDIPTLDLSHSWWNQNAVEEFEIGGVQYAALGDICLYTKGAPLAFFFNKQLIEDNKLEDPYQLVNDGTWPIDKMMEMSIAAARDVTSNNKVDELEDVFGFIGENSTLGYMFVGCGIDFISRDSDDNIELAFPLERAAVVVEKLVPFMRNKSVSIYAGDWYGKYDPFADVMIPAFMENRGLFFSNQLLMALDFRAMDADFGILPMPKADETQEEYHGYSNGAWNDFLIVPSTNRDLERTGNVLEAMGYYSQQYITPAFIETTVLDKSIRDEKSAEMVSLILDSQVYDIARLFDWGGIEKMVTTLLNSTKTDVASSYESNKPKIEEAIKNTMDALLER